MTDGCLILQSALYATTEPASDTPASKKKSMDAEGGTHRIQSVGPMLRHDIHADQAVSSKAHKPSLETGDET